MLNSHCNNNEKKKIKKKRKTAIAAMHGLHSVLDIGHCMVKHCDARGGLSLVDQ